MTTVTLDLLPSGSIAGFTSAGHARFAKSGSDIVCAGISAILQTAYLGLKEISGLFVGMEMNEKKGYMKLVLERDLSQTQRHDADIILNTMRLGLLSLGEAYPDYLNIVERRCN